MKDVVRAGHLDGFHQTNQRASLAMRPSRLHATLSHRVQPLVCPGFTGDRYEGEWQHGKESGTGTAQAPDGSTFYGYWVDGKRHGEGVSSLSEMAEFAYEPRSDW